MANPWISAARVARLLGDSAWASPAYQDLSERMRLLIVDGRIGHHTRLPSERELAAALSLSRSTIAAAYVDLRERGYAEARRGSGNYAIAAARSEATALLGTSSPSEDLIELTRAAPRATPGLMLAYERAVEGLPRLLGTTGYEPHGLATLREAIADRFRSRGLPTEPEQILITSGALSAIAILARCLLSRGDRVLVDAPTYPNAIDAFRQHGARLVAQPLGDEGWDPDAIEFLVRQTSPRLAYLIPDFHNPTGHQMPAEHRARLRDVFREHRVTMIIDETMTELPLDGQPEPAPMGAGAADAITIGSASKVFWGGLRVGWIRAPRSLVRPLVQSRIALDLGTAPLEQLVVAELLRDSSTLLELQRERLAEQRDHLIATLADRLPAWTLTRPTGGLSVWMSLPGELSGRLAANAERHGLLLTPGSQFFPDGGGERRLRIAYTLPTETLTEAVDRLATLWSEVATLGDGSTGLSLTA
jgi:DNA-binding transcriptional MocR family regulator